MRELWGPTEATTDKVHGRRAQRSVPTLLVLLSGLPVALDKAIWFLRIY